MIPSMRMLLAALVFASCGLSQGAVPPVKSTVESTEASNTTATATTVKQSPSPSPHFSQAPQLPKNSSAALRPLYGPYSKNKPRFQNEALLQHLLKHPDDRLDLASALLSGGQRQSVSADLPVGSCAPGIPCSNGACCSKTGVCSYAPSSCGPDVCISNCDAKAPCGQYADPKNAHCPLNVCCSQYGFCGSTSEFCGTGCQTGFGGCGPPPTPSCSSSGGTALKRRIGYYESWATTRPCDVVAPEDLEVTGLTHINFAFSFFDPSTFQLSPMDANSALLYSRFTALKAKQPGLQTWISVGGWSFNDATNTPNTQHAFSNMVSSQANRQAFIRSLLSFTQTYGFDGIDIDWEYPVADDRGGVAADFTNFPIFLAELRAASSTLGVSITLPSSYWYLQHFDVVRLEPYVDWFNLMSYDIHGVWDSSNRFTGPYIRPHTNLTEIEDGLSLLWRAGVNPSKVVLGLGWYGRSFTLADPACNTPNGVCQFTAGAAAGECTRASGVLSNAEIGRLLATGAGVQSYDKTAGVRWLTYNTNQWVSYDDGVTIQQKIATANSLCLGGIMIWALDQDNADGQSMNDLLGIGKANGVTKEAADSFKNQLGNATLQHAIASSCYWSLCGGSCITGYFGVTEARGQVAGLQQNSVCSSGEFQTLCCAPGTTLGTCQWEGFRGVGFPCSPACSDPKATIVARNSNSYGMNLGGQLADLTCTGGFQAFCCVGFVPSSITNSRNLLLYGQTPVLDKRDTSTSDTSLSLYERNTDTTLEKRVPPLLISGLGALCLAGSPLAFFLAPLTFGLSLAVEGTICAIATAAAVAATAIIGFAIILIVFGWLFGGSPSRPNIGTPVTPAKTLGQWPVLDFGSSSTSGCDCVVTYTCRYGLGWDEICDNQRWAINKLLNGRTVYHIGPQRASGRRYSMWRVQRHEAYRTLVQGDTRDPDAGCHVDEFPMGDLLESGNKAPQGCRLVHSAGNIRQGADYRLWKSAQWRPCSTYRQDVCSITDGGPPVTWKFGPLNGNRGPGSGQHFIDAYGFDSQTPGSLCFASYSYTMGGKISTTQVVDHGFRVLNDDPMYGVAYGWSRQSWHVDPRPTSAAYRAYNYQPGIFQKRELTLSGNDSSTSNDTDPSPNQDTTAADGVCHANLRPLGNGRDQLAEASELDYNSFLFVDMDGNPIDSRKCSFIYEDDSQMRIVLDEHGKVVHVYTGDEDDDVWSTLNIPAMQTAGPVTQTTDLITISVTTGLAHVAGSVPRSMLPAATTWSTVSSGSIVTPAS